MYRASYRARASHSWRYRRPKPFASWPASCISVAWEKVASVAGEKLCAAARMDSNGAGELFIAAVNGG
jgi:hypothetical protein